MNLPDFQSEANENRSKAKAAILVIGAFCAILIFVFVANFDKLSNSKKPVTSTSQADASLEETSPSVSFEAGTVHVSDLDFYNDFKERDEEKTDKSEEAPQEESVEEPVTEANDGKHTLIVNDDYTTEWVPISPILPKHSYDFTNLYNQSGKMRYFVEGKCESLLGVEISQSQGNVDFNKLKEDGYSFVMLRVGARGYRTGQITLDDKIADNLKKASDAGLDIGLYFLSQAKTKTEAKEEAKQIIDTIGDYIITYPVVFYMPGSTTEKTRTDSLTKQERTTVLTTFLDEIKAANLLCAVMGTKKNLIKDIDLTKVLGTYEVCLSDTANDLPDFPYSFELWKYSTKGTADGVSGSVSQIISFEDYTLR